MTVPSNLNEAIVGYKDYFNTIYVTDQQFRNEIIQAYTNPDIAPAIPAQIETDFSLGGSAVRQLFDLHQSPNSTIAGAAADAFLGFYAGYFEQISKSWQVIKVTEIQAIQASASTTYWEAQMIGLRSNQYTLINYPYMGQATAVSQAIAKFAFSVAGGFAAYEIGKAILNGDNSEAAKAAISFSSATSASLVAGTLLAPFLPAALVGVTAAAVGLGVGLYINSEWGNITSAITSLVGQGLTAADAAQQWAASHASAFESWLDATGQQAIDQINAIDAWRQDITQDFADLLGPVPVFTNDLPPHLQEMALLFSGALNASSPLILDLDGDGVETTNLVNTATGGVGAGAVYWDSDNDGFREASAWVGKDDGLLVRDLNSNGVIDNHSELFGSATTDGFTVLTALDSNSDNQITSADVNWNTLKVWHDANGDGITQAGELKTLAELGITSISLADSTLSGVTNNDNPVTHHGTFVMNGQTRSVDDVWFRYDNTNSVDTRAYTFNPDTLLLPELRGYGQVSTMSIAMSNDATLLGQMQTIANANLTTLTSSSFDLSGKVTALMFRWAGVDGVNPVGRGDWDAQKLAFLEKFLGQTFDRNVCGNDTINALNQAWSLAHNAVLARVMFQSAGQDLFTTAPVYNYATDTFTGAYAFDASTLTALVSGQTLAAQQIIYSDVFKMLDGMFGIDNVDAATQSAIAGVVTANDSTGLLNYNFLAASVGFNPSEMVMGTNNAETITGSDNYVTHELLYGAGGNDIINGMNGSETIIGGAGNDTLSGGLGDDTYVYGLGDGSDTITDPMGWSQPFWGTNKLVFSANITPANVLIAKSGIDVTFSFTTGAGSVNVLGQDGWSINNAGVDTVEFADGTVWTRSDIAAHYVAQQVAAGVSTISGFDLTNDTITANAAAETIYGLGGNDVIRGGGGNDTIWGGVGNDTYIYNVGDGFDTITDNLGWQQPYLGINTLQFGAGLNSTNVFITKTGGDVALSFTGNTGAVTLIAQDAWFTNNAGADSIVFGDGVTWNRQQLATAYVAQEVARGAQNITGFDAYADTITGNAQNNTLTGLGGDDIIRGGAGNDTLSGGVGNDTYIYNAGDGYDIITDNLGWSQPHLGTNTLQFGTGLNSTIAQVAKSGGDVIISFTGYTGAVTLQAQDAWLMNNAGADNIVFGDGVTWNRQQLATTSLQQQTASGAANIYGFNAYGDIISGNSANNNLYGYDGDDTFKASAGNDLYDGGNGVDTVDYSLVVAGTTINFSSATQILNGYTLGANTANDGQGGADTFSYVENFIGTGYNDYFYGSANNDNFTGGAGNDWMSGNAGNDTLNGGAGVDTASYSTATAAINVNLSTGTATDGLGGTDTLTSIESVVGSAYADTFTGGNADETFLGGAGNDTINGGSGVDVISFTTSTASVLANLSTSSQTLNGTVVLTGTVRDGLSGTDTVSNIENITGSAQADWMVGSDAANVLDGGAGVDNLNGGNGDDTLIGGAGSDTLTGGSGVDTISYAANSAGVLVNLSNATQVLNTFSVTTLKARESATDTDSFTGIEKVIGSSYDDWFYGGSANETFIGGAGNDTINGAAGNDTVDYSTSLSRVLVNNSSGPITLDNVNLTANKAVDGFGGTDTLSGIEYVTGSAFNDFIYNSTGANQIDGGAGNDWLFGAAGADQFIWRNGGGSDTIADFVNGTDKIRLLGTGASYASLSFVDTANGATVTLNGNVIFTLTGVQKTVFDSTDFLFS